MAKAEMIRRARTFATLCCASACMAACMAGCATPPREIPIGEWAGTGTYVDYEAVGADADVPVPKPAAPPESAPAPASAESAPAPAPAEPAPAPPADKPAGLRERVKSASYPTRLKISPIRVSQRDALHFEIVSDSGPFMDIPERKIEMGFDLIKLRTLPNGSTQYAFLQKPPDSAITSADLYAKATAFPVADGLVLLVDYASLGGLPDKRQAHFFDIFRFHDGEIDKTGSIRSFDPKPWKLVSIDWTERLTPVK